MKKLLILFVVLAVVTFRAEAREKINFDKGWRFILADSAQMSLAMYDDSAWRMLNVPHDWAIEGDFSASAPSGNSGGALPGGVGWYRKSFEVAAADKGKLFYIDFDGVYMNAKVWINGQLLGQRPYGYSSFRFDLTPHLKFGARNVVAVRVDNSDQPNSRWYSGCGIYRHVWLVKTEKIHVAHWGTHVVAEGNKVSVSVSIDNNTTSQQTVVVRNKIISPAGVQVASASKKLSLNPSAKSISSLSQLKVSRPQIWSCETPYIYKVVTTIEQNGKVVDTYETPTGFRTFKFDAEKGFSLNGKSMKINGVCQHHDLGCLGAAVNEDALYRQLRILKEMGTNAVRCSHNPPAPELLAMCDTMGLIVMDESFDMWRRRKTKNDYARFFDQWAERDLTDLVLRDRNHPSILMWSIGNEVLEQWSSADADTLSAEQANLILNAGHDASTLSHGTEMSVNSLLCKSLCEIIRRLDNTRPITAGCNEPDPKNLLFKSGALDIIGFNYHHQWVKDVPKNFPGKPFIFSESVSALQTRGFYMMPSDSVYKAPIEWWLPYQDPSFQCSAYDNMHASWSSTHEETWDVVKHNDFVGGQFIWTGFDYIGEPTPYGFPARSSYFGIVDLAGFPKDSYYMYQSEWTDKQVLHLFPHWNWLDGQHIDLWCYYNNADEVELFINGRSQGVKAKKDDHEYHLMWRVKFEPGEVKAVARKNGKVVAEKTIRTSGAPAQLRMTSDRIRFGNNPNGDNLAFITVEVIDKDGNLCPRADDQVFFEVEGGRIVGVDNGNPISMERFKDTKRKAFNGKCLVVVATDGGDVTVRAKGYQLGGSEVMVKKSM